MEKFILKVSKLDDFKNLKNHLSDNKYYDSLQNSIIKNIDGRICHHRIRILHTIFKLNEFNSYLEIGVHNGSSMSYVVSNNKSINCYGIDLFENTYGNYKTKDNINLKRTKSNIDKNNKHNSKVELIKGNSFLNNTVDKLNNCLNQQVDVLFIDGDHSYRGVKNDFINYSKFVKSNGIIVIDDFDLNKINNNYRYPGIMKFVYEYLNGNSNYKILGVYSNNELLLIKK